MKSKKLNSKYITSVSNNPYFNLAIEEFLVNNVKENEVILYLWQNKNTVVVGSNQNPWKECNIKKIRDDGVKLARRLSGGGTVYHDLGNLNFTFIMGQELFDEKKQTQVILDAVNSFGLNAEFSGRNDLLINGKKFSGNAYYFGDDSSYHHGTLLVDVDLLKLSKYLTPSKQKIVSKGVDSVKSRVINLSSVQKDMTIEKLKERICQSFQKQYGTFLSSEEMDEQNITDPEVSAIFDRYTTWEWQYGESPSFDVFIEKRFDWGEIQIGLGLIDGRIEKIEVYSDALNTTFVDKLKKCLKGTQYENSKLVDKISSIKYEREEKYIFEDILKLLKC